MFTKGQDKGEIKQNIMADKNITLRDVDSNNLYPTTQVGNVLGLSDYVANYASKDLSNVTSPAITAGSITTGSGDRVIEQYYSSDRNTWYRKWASGWKECGLRASLPTSGSYINLPLTFSNTQYTIQATQVYSNSSRSNFVVADFDTYRFKIFTQYVNDTFIYCCGY